MIDYTLLFRRIGKITKYVNEYIALQREIAQDNANEITELFSGSSQEDVIGLYPSYISEALSVEGFVSEQVTFSTAILAALQQELNSVSTEPDELIDLLYTQMEKDGQTILANTISTPTITYDNDNIGTAILLSTTSNIDGITDQRVISEQIKFRCLNDIYTSGENHNPEWLIAGWENFNPESYKYLDFGNGSSSIIQATNDTVLDNGDFESFTDDEPDSWDVTSSPDTGTGTGATTTITPLVDEDTDSFRGDAALRLYSNGDPAYTFTTLSQDVSIDNYVIYVMTCRLKRNATLDRNGSRLRIYINTENELDDDIEIFDADASDLDTDWTLFSIFFVLPISRSELQLTAYIKWSSIQNIPNDSEILIDDFIISPATMFGNVHYAMIPGAIESVVEDTIQVNTENNYVGLFQSFMGRFYNKMLPTPAGTETGTGGTGTTPTNTINDSYAE